MPDFTNLRVICKNEYFKAFATKICDVAPLALQMLLSRSSCLFVQVAVHTWYVTVFMILIFKTVFLSPSFLMRFHCHLDFSNNLASAVD